MAKVGFWLNGAKGKLAKATIYKQNGETVMREIVSPTNPKTTQQLMQRIVMHTIMAAYSKMKAICDHSFEGVKKGQDTMSYFMKQNIQFAREKIATMQAQGSSAYQMFNFAPLGLKGFTPNQYQVAMGSLPRIQTYINDDAAMLAYIAGFSANTYADVISTLGLRRGDQLTFCLINSYGQAYGQDTFEFCRVILDPTNADGTPADLSSAFIGANGKINLPSVRNEGNFFFAFNERNQITFGVDSNIGGIAAFTIASRKGSDGNWLRSTTYMTYLPGHETAYSLGECLDMAENGGSNIYTANALYLNNAGQTVAPAGDSSAPVVPVDPTPQPGQPSFSSVSVYGVTLTSGTTGEVIFPAGTEVPAAATVQASVSNANGKTLALLVANTNQEIAHGVVADGAVSFSANLNSGVTYKLAWDEGEETTDLAYRFSVSVASSGGGNQGGDDI